jgi:micrococcal nuclease
MNIRDFDVMPLIELGGGWRIWVSKYLAIDLISYRSAHWTTEARKHQTHAMKHMKLLLVLIALLSVPNAALAKTKKRSGKGSVSTLTLNGELTQVHWSDGDSFHILTGEHKGRNTRLVGYNTLETFGPVHQWGTWTPKELYSIAKQAGVMAAKSSWECTTTESNDGYKRLLVDCPALTEFLVSEGVAIVYSVSPAIPKEALLKVQQVAKEQAKGMWKKGIPRGILTSVHSADEEKLEDGAYNRVVDTQTGEALRRKHEQTYSSCEVVCEETEKESSCLTYVPFSSRYKNKPDCLKK